MHYKDIKRALKKLYAMADMGAGHSRHLLRGHPRSGGGSTTAVAGDRFAHQQATAGHDISVIGL